MGARVAYNERSWAIDLIGHIKNYIRQMNNPIKEAGGESSVISEGSSLFPDVLLYGDTTSYKILQGWELKMPDTDIGDPDFFHNAKMKANKMGLDSFVLWNVTHAHLYVLDKAKEEFNLLKAWHDLNHIHKRSQVQQHTEQWKLLAQKIIDEVNTLLIQGSLEGRRFIEAYNSGGITSLLLENTEVLSEQITKQRQQNKHLNAQVILWYEKYGKEYGADKNDLSGLSKAVLSNWIGKFLFAHILTSKYQDALTVFDIVETTSVEQALNIFQTISEKCNFWTIFSSSLALELLPKNVWSHFLQFNSLLKDLKIGNIDQAQLSNMMESTAHANIRKLKGQYATPVALAKLLVKLTLDNPKEDKVADFCSGSGTIIRTVLEEKMKSCSTVQAAANTYASDSDAYANQMTTFALAKSTGINIPIKVFNADVFDLCADTEVAFKDPNTGDNVYEKLGQFDAIVSNLPFVAQKGRSLYKNAINQTNQALKAESKNKSEARKLTLDGKSDVYAYIPFHLLPLLKDGGMLGIIISNSWLGTSAGKQFFLQLTRFYDIEYIITSGAGRWFQNANVVANLLILRKKFETSQKQKTPINFVILKRPLPDFENDDYLDVAVAHILDGTVNHNELLDMNRINIDQIINFLDLGMGLNNQFVNCDWLLNLPFTKTSDLFVKFRGERRGWDALFYPKKNQSIENEFLQPVLLNSKAVDGYVINPDDSNMAFCCCASEESLLANNKLGAYKWIQKFKHQNNKSGVPLVESLKKKGGYWYEFGDAKKADFILPLNIDKRFFVARLTEPAICNQRLIGLKALKNSDIELLHALLNSTIFYFLIEGNGFGRGLGVLDFNSTNLISIPLPNPDLLSLEQINSIKIAFKPLLSPNRKVLNIADELEEADRIHFDKTILEAYGMEHVQQHLYDGFLKLVAMRLEAREHYQ